MVVKPSRVQRKRTKGWRCPVGTVIVTRPGRFGNPFPVTPKRTPAEAVAAYRLWLDGKVSVVNQERPTLQTIRLLLRGHDLACWCAPGAPCHADVLLELANSEVQP